jgi:DNA-binding beta-propeller fold protein YncE
MREKFRSALFVLPTLLAFGLTACSNSSYVLSSKSLVWVTTASDQKIRSYTVDWRTGALWPVGGSAAVATGSQPSAIAASKDGLTLYVANAGDGTVGVYTNISSGALVSAGPAVNAGSHPMALAVDPTGNLLFVADQGSDAILVFSTAPGTLAVKASFPVSTPAVTGGSAPIALAIAPTSFHCVDNRTLTPVTQNCYALYAANQLSNNVTGYVYFVDGSGNFVRGSVDLAGNFVVGGTVSGSPYAVGSAPSALAFSRCAGFTTPSSGPCNAADKNSLFVANSGSDDVTVFSACVQLGTCQNGEVNPDGTLTTVSSSIAAGPSPSAVVVDPIADFVYVVNGGTNQLSEFQYSPSAGSLAPLGAATSNGNSVFSGSITPNLASGANRSWVVVTDSNGLSTYGVASGGSLNASSSSQASLPGPPSAILVR